MLKPVETPRQHRAALKRIDRPTDARACTPEPVERAVLTILVERYEREALPIDLPSPAGASGSV
jgi:hypothetical protein